MKALAAYRHEGQMTRAELVRKLLETCHLNVPERRQLVPPAVHFSEILAVIRDVVAREGWFSSGKLTLEELEAGTCRFHHLKYDPKASDLVNDWCGPSIPATTDYPRVDSAAEAFIDYLEQQRWLNWIKSPTWASPRGEIDGIEIWGLPTRIIPGYRIGPVCLTGTIDKVIALLGPCTKRHASWIDKVRALLTKRYASWQGTTLHTWDSMGFWVVSEKTTGNILWISIDESGSEPWTDYATPEGIHLGTPEQHLVSVLGAPEGTVSGGGGRSLYYDRRGIRFTIFDSGPNAGMVSAIRVVWPAR